MNQIADSTDRGLNEQHGQMKDRFGISVDDQDSMLARALGHALSVDKEPQGLPRSVNVALFLRTLGVDENTLVATLLSDPRLREQLTMGNIRATYGRDIAQLVDSVHLLNTFRECEHEAIQGREQGERLRRMLLAMVKDVRALVIKLAYRLERLRLLAHERYLKRRCIARETLDIYAPLAHRMGIAQMKWELEDMAFRYLEPRVYKRIAADLEEKRAVREAYVVSFVSLLQEALEREQVPARVSGRPKHIYSIWQKMRDKDRLLEELYDLRAVRVIVEKVPQCYAVLGVVHMLWHHIPNQFDDYIANPKGNGYQSLHTAVMGPEGKVVEVQIRTEQMHEFAERGVAAHWLYKEGTELDSASRNNIAALQRLLENQDSGIELLEDFRDGFLQDRVFVFTPVGEVIELPKGSTPLDFAYSIHTEVGHRCRGAKVDGRIVALNYQLKSGEKVQILTTKQSRPSRDWLNPQTGFLVTSRARAKVRHWFKRQDRERNIQDGHLIIERELRRLGVDEGALEGLAKRFNLAGLEDLYAEVGRAEISVSQIVGNLQVPGISALTTSAPSVRRGLSRVKPGRGVKIRGVGNLLTQIAHCCHPMPGDAVVGYITRGKGVTVHRVDCVNAVNLAEQHHKRLIDVEWVDEGEVYEVQVRIEAYDRRGLLQDMVSILSKEKVSLLQANSGRPRDDHVVTMTLTLEISNTEQLSRLLARIVQVPNVVDAHRHAA